MYYSPGNVVRQATYIMKILANSTRGTGILYFYLINTINSSLLSVFNDLLPTIVIWSLYPLVETTEINLTFAISFLPVAFHGAISLFIYYYYFFFCSFVYC